MRHAIAVVALMFTLVVGLVMPAIAVEVTSATTSSTTTGMSLDVYLENDRRAPAGRVEIWFSDHEYGEPLFYYRGDSHELTVGEDIPAFRWCVIKLELAGDYADQIVKSTWPETRGIGSNIFAAEIRPGVQEARFFIKGKEKHFLRIAFVKIPVGSTGFTTEQSFHITCQSDEGLNDYLTELVVARHSWPDVRYFRRDPNNPEMSWFVRPGDKPGEDKIDDTHVLWATLHAYETWYQDQGMVIAGTERFPRNNTISLRNLLEIGQREANAVREAANQVAAEAEYQRKLAEAEAARKAAEERRIAEAAENQCKLAEAEAARKAAEERLANPPAPVTTTTTETTTEVVQSRPEAPVLCSWRLNLPTGRIVCVETLDHRGERRYPKRYSGYIPFNNYVVGQDLCLRLTWEGKSQPDPWKVVRDVHDGMVVDYNSLEVR